MRAVIALGLACALSGCGPGDAQQPKADGFHWVVRVPGAAVLSVHGTAKNDVWMAGADDGQGPVVLHWDGLTWERRPTGTRADLWWVHAIPAGPVFFGGSLGTLLSYQDGVIEALESPGTSDQTVFGVWAATPDDAYAVGSRGGQDGFVWHYDGVRFSTVALPNTFPVDAAGYHPGLFKVWGTSPSSVWLVGSQGVVLHGNANDGFELVRSGGDATLFTVHAEGEQVAMVGGGSSGLLYEVEGGELVNRTPPNAPLLQGVCVATDGSVWAVGFGGSVYRGRGESFEPIDTGLDFSAAESLHSVWVDPSGGVWAAGGDVLTEELDQGLAWHRGAPVPEFVGD